MTWLIVEFLLWWAGVAWAAWALTEWCSCPEDRGCIAVQRAGPQHCEHIGETIMIFIMVYLLHASTVMLSLF